MGTSLLAFLLALVSSLALTPICRAAALRLGYVDKPKHDRWHRQPTALLGGMSIFLTVTILAAIFHLSSPLALLLAAGGAIFCVGLVDDLVSLKPSTKLVAEIALASALVFFGYRLHWTQSLKGRPLTR